MFFGVLINGYIVLKFGYNILLVMVLFDFFDNQGSVIILV